MRKGDLKRLAGNVLKTGSTLQSGDSGGGVDPDRVERAVEQALLQRAESDAAAAVHDAAAARSRAASITRIGLDAAKAIDAGADEAELSDQQWSSLQAIIEVAGRPALRFPNGAIENPSPIPANEHWNVLLGLERNAINKCAASVGRITLGSNTAVEGTAWQFGKNVVVTNRHVAEALVTRDGEAPSTWVVDSSKQPIVNFTATAAGAAPTVFPIVELVFCGSDVDIAVLRLGENGKTFPSTLPICWAGSGLEPDDRGSKPDLDVYVIGHPWQIGGSVAIERVFGVPDGTKRCSFGYALTRADEEAVFEHDCSTLGGNSGSCVVSAQTHAIVGIHFGGVNTQSSGLGDANVAILFSSLASHPARAALKAT